MSGEVVKIRNIAKIKEATVKLNGLNIIAGLNDTGKSTIGKTVFSIVKAINKYKEDFEETKEAYLKNAIEHLYLLIRRQTESQMFKELFVRNKFFKEINNLLQLGDSKGLRQIFAQREEFINNLSDNRLKQQALELLHRIEKIAVEEENTQEQIAKALEKAFSQEFASEITPKFSTDLSEIKYLSGKNTILEINIKKNHITKLDLKDDQLYFNEATYIESPVYLQLVNLIENNKLSAFHLQDLIKKIKQSRFYNEFSLFSDNRNKQLLEKINKIVNGHFEFDENLNEFKFKTSDNLAIHSINAASGIKSFGLIQLLIEAEILNERSLLIIDEPENHLHPQWQIVYTDVITELVKNDISVIISSHSPYIIQGFNFYIRKKMLEDTTNFYLAEADGNSARIKDLGLNTDPIFQLLAQPLNRITI